MGRARIVRTCRASGLLSPKQHRREVDNQDARDKARELAGAAWEGMLAPMPTPKEQARIERAAERAAAAWAAKRQTERKASSKRQGTMQRVRYV